VRFPSRTSRSAPGAPAATSPSTSFCSPAASVFVAVLGVAIADAAIAAAAIKQESIAPQTASFLPRPTFGLWCCELVIRPPFVWARAVPCSMLCRSGTRRSRTRTSRRSPSCRATRPAAHLRGEVVPPRRWPVGGALVQDWLVRLVLHHTRLHRRSSWRTSMTSRSQLRPRIGTRETCSSGAGFLSFAPGRLR
jgi:hypothetical protein